MINKIDLMDPSGLILVGRTGENAFRTITFDASTWGADFPDATYTVVYKRSDGYIYPVLVNAAADAIVWSPTDTDTAVSGNGQIEVRLLDGETIGKTIVMQTFVAPSLSGDESEPSTPAPDWVNDVAADADRAEAAVEHYPKIVNGVWHVWDVQSEDFISTGIEAQGEEGYSPTVTVTAIDGGHRVTITDADGAHTFDVLDGEDDGSGSVFVAVRGTTTQAEIETAHSAGNAVICIYQDRIYYLSEEDGATAQFRTNPDAGGMVYALIVVGSRWTGINYNLALKSDIPSLAAYRTASAQDEIDSAQNTAIAAKYTKPSGGIPDSDIASAATWNAKGTYSKPNGGIPKSDLASDVQSSLGKADTALQQHQSLAAYRTSAAQDTIDAGKLDTTGNAYRSASIPMGHLDATSTATVMTATVDGITELRDGVCMWLLNGVITSASGFTLNVNGLGAKPCYSSLAAASRSTTIFNVNYTMLFVYNSTRVDGGCWDIVYGVDTNTTYTPPKLGFGYGTCTTAAATAAKTASISSYALTAGGIVSIKFENDVPAGATLNITSKGAKAIYYRGAAITADVIKAGDTATFVYSTYYHLIAIDRDEAGSGDAPIQTVKVNGTALVPDANKAVDVGCVTDINGLYGSVDLSNTYVSIEKFSDRTGKYNIILSISNGNLVIDGDGTPLSYLIDLVLNNCNIWFVLPSGYITGVPSGTDMIRFQMTGANMDTTAPTVSLSTVYGGKVYSATLSPVSTTRMEGQLNVYNIALPSAESNSFGGA